MSEQEPTVHIGYTASSNATFYGAFDTGVTWSEWEAMTEEQRNQATVDAMWSQELVSLFTLDKGETSYDNRW